MVRTYVVRVFALLHYTVFNHNLVCLLFRSLMKETGLMALPVLAKAWMMWFCIIQIIQKPDWWPETQTNNNKRHQSHSQNEKKKKCYCDSNQIQKNITVDNKAKHIVKHIGLKKLSQSKATWYSINTYQKHSDKETYWCLKGGNQVEDISQTHHQLDFWWRLWSAA